MNQYRYKRHNHGYNTIEPKNDDCFTNLMDGDILIQLDEGEQVINIDKFKKGLWQWVQSAIDYGACESDFLHAFNLLLELPEKEV